jgi:hypothetical protein
MACFMENLLSTALDAGPACFPGSVHSAHSGAATIRPHIGATIGTQLGATGAADAPFQLAICNTF